MASTDFIFFGSSDFSIFVLEALSAQNFFPSFVISTPPKPQGRGLELHDSPVILWAKAKKIPFATPAALREFENELASRPEHICLVASYGKIIPASTLSLPKKIFVNIHPSLLPRYRGPSPIQSQILADEKDTGSSLILLDKEIDHGPILAQEKMPLSEAYSFSALSQTLATQGAKLFMKILPALAQGEFQQTEQDHAQATFTRKFEKEDGILSSQIPERERYLRFLALQDNPGVSFEAMKNGKKIRAKIKAASWSNGQCIIERVLPENGREMSYQDFLRGGCEPLL